MSSRYPLPVSGMDSSILFPYFHHHPSEYVKPLSPVMTNQVSRVVEKRPWIAMKTPKVSKPNSNLQGSSSTEKNTLVLSTEKKRNKLGYHRTSVACDRSGHCRRRKIRCIPALGDKRCSNCIRLKKECNFYPVDQQSPVSGRRDTKGHGINERKLEESSTKTSSHISDISTIIYPGNLSLPLIQNLGYSQAKCQVRGGLSPNTDKVMRVEHNFDCNNSSNTNSSWINSDTLSIPENLQEIPPQWASSPSQPPLQSSFQSFTPEIQISPFHFWTAPHIDFSSPENIPWPTSQRVASIFNETQGSNSHHLFGPSESASTKSVENNVIKQVASGVPTCTSIKSVASIGSTLASMSDNSQQRQLASALSVSNPTWQQTYSDPKHASNDLNQYGVWSENHGDSILIKGESGNEKLSPNIYDGFESEAFYLPH
ncbi:hypothetical protein Golomagni_01056 [Golovinomyces magnicellulatus]|nr:hypothetical protein Golomagni_01056 [Golovinomyces magnicellulatus]